MSEWSETYTSVKNDFLDWMSDQANDGGNVTDVALRTINKAQLSLWRYRPWTYLLKSQTLTLTSKAATLPVDFGRVVRVYSDSDGDGKPDTFFYEHGRYDNGYKIRDVFAKATGHAFTITFYSTPANTVYLDHIVKLDDFTGTGTEYSYFPGDLLLAEAQYIHIVDSGLIGDEFQAIVNRRNELLRDYEEAHQYVNVDPRVQHNDYYGNEVLQETYTLDGEMASGTNRHSLDYDDGTI
jgi:hypothetical protein